MAGHFVEKSSYFCKLHTDSIEFSPNGEQVLVGAYELNESTGERRGQVIKFDVNENQIKKSFELTIPGVLDLCWMSTDLCLAVTSSGDIYIIHSPSSQPLIIQTVIKLRIITADESGNMYLVDSAVNKVASTWKAHEFETWGARFNKNDSNLILSGGDDCFACVWDQRVGFTKSVLKRRHEMGVCSLSGVPTHSHLISTGCFDEKLRIWDLRSNGNGSDILVCHSEGGGVWRHKWSPCSTHLLMACMHAGFVVGRLSPLGLEATQSTLLPLIQKPAFYRPTTKLAYGVDWSIDSDYCSSKQLQFEALLATCSFYDNCVSFASYVDSTI